MSAEQRQLRTDRSPSRLPRRHNDAANAAQGQVRPADAVACLNAKAQRQLKHGHVTYAGECGPAGQECGYHARLTAN